MPPATGTVMPRASAPARIALFAATAWEVRAVRAAFPGGRERRYDGQRVFVSAVGDQELWLIRTGVGHQKAARAASWLLQHGPFELVVSTGFACALGPARIGALLTGGEVRFVQACEQENERQPAIRIASSGADDHRFVAFMSRQVPSDRRGLFVSVDRIVVQASEKREYARLTGAVGLDMESAALAMASQRAHVPFVILRTVSDVLDEDLPLDFNLFLRPTDWPKAVGSVLRAPRSLCGLGRLRRQSRIAAARLTEVFRAYAQAMSPEPTRTAEHA